jgi:predicted RNA-binding protein with RPS1 domain
MSALTQIQINSIKKLYSLCYSLRGSEGQVLTDIAKVIEIADGRVMISVDNEYYTYDQKILWYIGMQVANSNMNIEQLGNGKFLVFQNPTDMLSFMNLIYLDAKSPSTRELTIMNGEVRTTFGEIFKSYFDINDLNEMTFDKKVLVDIISSEIVNNLNLSFRDISEGDEVTKLFESEIEKSIILSSFYANFPELKQKIDVQIENKIKPRIETMELRIEQLKELNDRMGENRRPK